MTPGSTENPVKVAWHDANATMYRKMSGYDSVPGDRFVYMLGESGSKCAHYAEKNRLARLSQIILINNDARKVSRIRRENPHSIVLNPITFNKAIKRASHYLTPGLIEFDSQSGIRTKDCREAMLKAVSRLLVNAPSDCMITVNVVLNCCRIRQKVVTSREGKAIIARFKRELSAMVPYFYQHYKRCAPIVYRGQGCVHSMGTMYFYKK